jgi:hypothetical protein
MGLVPVGGTFWCTLSLKSSALALHPSAPFPLEYKGMGGARGSSGLWVLSLSLTAFFSLKKTNFQHDLCEIALLKRISTGGESLLANRSLALHDNVLEKRGKCFDRV